MILLTTQKTTIAEAMKFGAANRGIYEEAAAFLIKQPSFETREVGAVPFVRKFYISEKIESGGKLSAGQVRHWITTDSIDRDAEIVRPRGLDLKTYRQNPVVFWGHNYSEPANIIGSNVDLAVEDHGIRALTQFRMREQKAADIFNCYADETLRAWSIGFIPIKGHAAKPMEGGIDKPDYGPDQIIISLGPSDPTVARWVHDKAILLEYSAVGVPANPDALTEAVGKGMLNLSDDLMRDLEMNVEEIHRKRVDAGIVARKSYYDFGKEAKHEGHEKEKEQISGEAAAEAPAPGGDEASGEIVTDPAKAMLTDLGAVVPAPEPKPIEQPDVKDISDEVKSLKALVLSIKEGRVLSDKNRKLISTVLTTMEDAAAAMKKAYTPLKELIDATDPGAGGDGEGDSGKKPPVKPANDKPADDGSGQVGADGKPVGDSGKKPNLDEGKGIMITPEAERPTPKGITIIGGEADVVHESVTAAPIAGIVFEPAPAPRKGIFDGVVDKTLGRV
jgi:hypothetical protein